jgi:nucleotide-binding universal stress UspA family protein
MFAPKKILVPTDFSEYSDKALNKALEIAKQFNSKIFLLHVNDTIQECAVDYCVDYNALKKVKEDVVEGTKKRMEAEIAKFLKFENIEVSYDIREGNPIYWILREQEEQGVDLIVIGTHGKRGFINQLLGSTSEKVLKGAKCSVLLARD